MSDPSAIICTRNRPDSLIRAVRSILAPGAERFELLVMDQSDDDNSERALQPFRSDPRLRYVRTPVRGKGAALNEALGLARGAIVVCTDDDCEAPPGWVTAMAAAMAAHPDVAVVFCNVLTPPHDRSAGYIPAYERSEDRLVTSLMQARRGLGLGAGMALRREAVLAFGGFDDQLGPGSRFASGDDWDISIRALLKGWQVYDTAAVGVLHHGFRTLAEGRQHAKRDWISIGALCAKPIRAGHLSAVPLALSLFFAEALWPPLRDVLRVKKPSGLSRIVGFARGFAGGLATPVDRASLRFRD